MKFQNRVLRFAVAMTIAGAISTQIPVAGVSALAQDGYTNTITDNSGNFLGINGLSNRNVIQGAVFLLTAYGLYTTFKDSRAGAAAGGGAASGGGAAGGGGGTAAGNTASTPSGTPIVAGDRTKSIYEVPVSTDNFSTLKRLVDGTDLATPLKDDAGPYTVFAPTNAAFAKLPEATLTSLADPANSARLKSILQFHVVQGRYTIADLKKKADGDRLLTITGDTLNITNTGGLKINNIPVIEQDIEARNGITHPLETVLTPGG